MQHWKEILTVTPAAIHENTLYKAMEGDKIVGFYSLTNSPRELVLNHMFVHPDEIGHGVGRALMEHVIRQAADSDLPNMEIESDPHAEGFYLKMGARRVGARIYKLEGQQRMLPLLYLSVHQALQRLDAHKTTE
jgi:GNAT superfamily N-acetyltransferase